MIGIRGVLPLAFILLTTACGGHIDDAPSRVPSNPPAAKAKTKATPQPVWYERYDLGTVAVKMRANTGQVAESSLRQIDRPYRPPDLQDYQRRLQSLRQEQGRLRRVNARLREQARLEASYELKMRQALAELQNQLAQFSVEQAKVTAQVRAVVREHGVLFERVSSLKLAQLEGPP